MPVEPRGVAARPAWACACVPAYIALLGVVSLAALAFAASGWAALSAQLEALFPLIGLALLWLLLATVIAWVLLAVTRTEPWLAPPVDALAATVIGLALAGVGLVITAVLAF